MRARCPNAGCGGVDSWEHFKHCYGVEPLMGKTAEEKVQYLVQLSRKIRTDNPIRPKPTEVPYRGDGGEITRVEESPRLPKWKWRSL